MRKIIALVMVLSICILSLVSCDILDDINIFNRTSRVKYPDGYTGGFTVNLNDKDTEIYWVETYEEAVEAIRLLKSHGSTFSSDSPAIFNYEGNLFDVKYCFKMDGEYGVDKQGIKYGDNPYDRWAKNVEVTAYAFFDDVTIDALVYGYVNDYHAYSFWAGGYSDDMYDDIDFAHPKKIVDNPSSDVCYPNSERCKHSYMVYYEAKDKEPRFFIKNASDTRSHDMITEDCLIAMTSTVVTITSIANAE